MKGVAAFLLGTGARIHRRAGRRLRSGRGQPSCAVLSVGGLSMGGAGKTPVAAAFASLLAQRGHRVVLASRGYKGASRKAVTVVSDGSTVRTSLAVSGDEPILLAAHAPGVPVLVGRDRRRVGFAAVARFGCDILILDDGFQHHRLTRDVDLVCIDADAGLGNGRTFPAGPLREPRSALNDADWFCLVGSVPVKALAKGDIGAEAEGLAEARARLGALLAPLHVVPERCAVAERRVHGLRRMSGDGIEGSSVSLAGCSVGLLAGLGRPENLRRSAEALGAEVVATRFFPDHHLYRPADLAGLSAEAPRWLTTEKDALKILPGWLKGTTLDVLEMRIEFAQEDRLLDRIEADLMAARSRRTGSRSSL